MVSSTVEDYLKRLYVQQQGQKGGSLVSTGRLAEALGVTPGTATAMVQTLAESGLVNYEPRRGARLTARGSRLALHVIRRHRLIELFLVEVLGLDWSEVHAEAERLEHAISDKVLARIDEMLGQPQIDPHGDPIPDSSGQVARAARRSLADCAPGERLRVARVGDEDPEFLRFVDESRLTPGRRVTLESRDALADSITLRPDGSKPMVVGTAAARRIFVEE